MMMKREGRVYRRCGCADPATGRPIGAGCPRLAKRGHGSWYVTLELPLDPDGRRRRIRRGGYPTRQAARQALAKLATPGPAGSAAITTGQWLGRWLACRTSPASSTVRGYAAHVRLYLQPHLGPILLAELTTAHVQAMFTAIIRQHQATGHRVTAATLARIRATLRAALNTAIRHGLITGNPARHVELPPARRPHAVVWTASRIEHWRATGERPPVAVWTAAQTAQFLHAIRGDRLYAAFHLIALRGMFSGGAYPDRLAILLVSAGQGLINIVQVRYRCGGGARAGVSRPACRGVELGHELAVGGPGRGEVVIAFGDLEAQVDGLLLEAVDLLAEGIDVGGCAEPGFAPCLLAERLGQPFLKLADTVAEPDGAFVGGEQVGLQRGACDSRAGFAGGCGRDGFKSVDPGEQVTVAVKEGAVHCRGAGDARHADLGAAGVSAVERGDDTLAAPCGVGMAAVPHRLGSGRRLCHASSSLAGEGGLGRRACRGSPRGACGPR